MQFSWDNPEGQTGNFGVTDSAVPLKIPHPVPKKKCVVWVSVMLCLPGLCSVPSFQLPISLA